MEKLQKKLPVNALRAQRDIYFEPVKTESVIAMQRVQK